MIKPWHLGPVLAAAALGASAYWWQQHKNDWSAPAPLRPDLPQYTPIEQPAALSNAQTLARPVMWTTRRPIELKAENQKNQQEQELAQSRLLAVLESGASRIALLRRANGTSMKLSAETRPWRLQSFNGRQAQFMSDDGRRVELQLEYAPATPPVASPRDAEPGPTR